MKFQFKKKTIIGNENSDVLTCGVIKSISSTEGLDARYGVDDVSRLVNDALGVSMVESDLCEMFTDNSGLKIGELDPGLGTILISS